MAIDRRRRLRVEVAEQLGRLRLAELLEREPPRRRHRERGRQARRRLPAAEGEREQNRSVRPAAKQRSEQLDRPGVAPLQVVEHDHERSVGREQLQQPADGAVRAVALVGDRLRRARRARSDGDDAGELVDRFGVPRLSRSSSCEAT